MTKKKDAVLAVSQLVAEAAVAVLAAVMSLVVLFLFTAPFVLNVEASGSRSWHRAGGRGGVAGDRRRCVRRPAGGQGCKSIASFVLNQAISWV